MLLSTAYSGSLLNLKSNIKTIYQFWNRDVWLVSWLVKSKQECLSLKKTCESIANKISYKSQVPRKLLSSTPVNFSTFDKKLID
jgi:hypothetical protein